MRADVFFLQSLAALGIVEAVTGGQQTNGGNVNDVLANGEDLPVQLTKRFPRAKTPFERAHAHLGNEKALKGITMEDFLHRSAHGERKSGDYIDVLLTKIAKAMDEDWLNDYSRGPRREQEKDRESRLWKLAFRYSVMDTYNAIDAPDRPYRQFEKDFRRYLARQQRKREERAKLERAKKENDKKANADKEKTTKPKAEEEGVDNEDDERSLDDLIDELLAEYDDATDEDKEVVEKEAATSKVDKPKTDKPKADKPKADKRDVEHEAKHEEDVKKEAHKPNFGKPRWKVQKPKIRVKNPRVNKHEDEHEAKGKDKSKTGKDEKHETEKSLKKRMDANSFKEKVVGIKKVFPGAAGEQLHYIFSYDPATEEYQLERVEVIPKDKLSDEKGPWISIEQVKNAKGNKSKSKSKSESKTIARRKVPLYACGGNGDNDFDFPCLQDWFGDWSWDDKPRRRPQDFFEGAQPKGWRTTFSTQRTAGGPGWSQREQTMYHEAHYSWVQGEPDRARTQVQEPPAGSTERPTREDFEAQPQAEIEIATVTPARQKFAAAPRPTEDGIPRNTPTTTVFVPERTGEPSRARLGFESIVKDFVNDTRSPSRAAPDLAGPSSDAPPSSESNASQVRGAVKDAFRAAPPTTVAPRTTGPTETPSQISNEEKIGTFRPASVAATTASTAHSPTAKSLEAIADAIKAPSSSDTGRFFKEVASIIGFRITPAGVPESTAVADQNAPLAGKTSSPIIATTEAVANSSATAGASTPAKQTNKSVDEARKPANSGPPAPSSNDSISKSSTQPAELVRETAVISGPTETTQKETSSTAHTPTGVVDELVVTGSREHSASSETPTAPSAAETATADKSEPATHPKSTASKPSAIAPKASPVPSGPVQGSEETSQAAKPRASTTQSAAAGFEATEKTSSASGPKPARPTLAGDFQSAPAQSKEAGLAQESPKPTTASGLGSSSKAVAADSKVTSDSRRKSNTAESFKWEETINHRAVTERVAATDGA